MVGAADFVQLRQSGKEEARVRTPAGQLPHPLSDAGVASLGRTIIVAGGRSSAGTQASVGELVPAG